LTAKKYEKEVYRVEARPLSSSEERVEKGYDIESKMPDGNPKYIEVKGMRGEGALELKKYQYKRIIDKKERTRVYVVINALKNPELFEIKGESLIKPEFLPSLYLSSSEWRSITTNYWKP